MLEIAREFIRTLWLNIRLTDALDVLLIAGLLYAVLAWMRDRVSRVVSFGILLIALVYGVAQLLDLYLTLSVFRVGLVGIVLALILVFQEDIRRLFEQIRVLNPLEHKKRGQFEREMDILVEAVGQMAQKRIGALIVLPGREALEVHLHGGIKAHAAISAPMLLSIFHPETPGHDGAIVVKDGQIDRFAVHLPLSTHYDELGPGGTRHAAALGLAERCDAMVIVVSEERGTISVGHEHALKTLQSAADLGAALHVFHRGERERESGSGRRRIPGWLTRNLGLKLLAFLLSAGLWLLFAYRVENIQRTYEVPIEYRGLSDTWSLQEPKPISARVELTGSERAFSAIEPGKLAVSVDLSELDEGPQKVALSEQQISVPAGVKVTEIAPQTLLLNARQMQRVRLPVKVEVEGEVAPEFRLKRVVSEPGRVEVELPESAVDEIQELSTEPVSIEGLSADKAIKTRLQSTREVRFLEDNRPEIEVLIELEASED